jgi:hypothetical protein
VVAGLFGFGVFRLDWSPTSTHDLFWGLRL